MNITETHKTIAALAGTVALAFAAVGHFQTKAEAEEAKVEAKKSVQQLRAEILLQRVKDLSEKEAKEGLTPIEKLERELNLEQVKAIQAEDAKVKK